MSSKRFSPTANLLRTSRLFSLPPPLPRPLPELTSSTTIHSNTATLPFPTQAAITTPQSSLCRGDWGLKRPLPLKSTTATSTPVIRIGAIDTWEHITDFDSASDHVLTLRKWQEMHIPISALETRRPTASMISRPIYGPHRSVFEPEQDSTQPNPGDPTVDARRWKFGGPWLAGRTEGEFNRYLSREIRRRRIEFRQYIRKHALAKKAAEKRRMDIEDGKVSETGERSNASDEISEDELRSYIISLRNDKTTLNALIHSFLDLPAPPTLGLSASNHGFGTNSKPARSMYSETGPPKTHPSAGLSYLRTSSHIQNHPLLGPQASPSPVQARILIPRKSVLSNYNVAKLGLGGVVCRDSVPASFREDRLPNGTPGISKLDPSIPGGAKLWVHPSRASIDVEGRIKLETVRANPMAIAIHEGKVFEQDARPLSPSPRRMPSLTSTTSLQHRYGIEGLKQSNLAGGENDIESHRRSHKRGWNGTRGSVRDSELGAVYQKLDELLSSEGSKTI
ncbi:hypothetical protein FGG08_001571 [Glutinoglossum americanum]|uniref:Uncharacterized protein n=1 Tax=Glutinoglossum americanum TaxID=1670608 RepID=A0A9P8IBC6_9PEZI|nr:hypothetical protein FGG08_001571 [Glutinoglossum americanum]